MVVAVRQVDQENNERKLRAIFLNLLFRDTFLNIIFELRFP